MEQQIQLLCDNWMFCNLHCKPVDAVEITL